MTDIVLDPITSGYNLSKINSNFEVVAEVVNQEVLHTTGGNNTMDQQLDMDSNRIINLPMPTSNNEPLILAQLEELANNDIGNATNILYIDPEAVIHQLDEFLDTTEDRVTELEDNAGGKTAFGRCSTVANMIGAVITLVGGNTITLAEAAAIADTGYVISTTVNNTTSKAGGADYDFKTRAQHRTDIGNPVWVPDGYANHYLFSGNTTYVAVLRHNGRVNIEQCGAVRQSAYDNSTIITAADIESATKNLPLFFPAGDGSFGIKSTIVRITQSAWTSGMDVGSYNSAAECSIYASIADFGDNGVMVRCATVGVAGQAMRFRGIEFVSNAGISAANLSAWGGTGLIGVDISHIKNGLDFFSCGFKQLKAGVKQVTANPYVDHVVFANTNFNLCGIATDGNSSGGFTYTDCRIFDCVDWINNPDCFVDIKGTWFNNTSFSIESCGIRAEVIGMTGGWIEGGNRVFQPTAAAMIRNVYMSESYSGSGSTKFHALGKDDTYYLFEGCRIASNTRLLDTSNITDWPSLRVEMRGNYGGTNFGSTADIRTSIANGMTYLGYGNANAERFNINQEDGHQLLGHYTSGTISGEMDAIRKTRRIMLVNNGNFQVSCSPVLVNYDTTSERMEYVKFQLLGSDNGAGGANAFEATLIIYKGFGSVWDYALTGSDAAAWTVTLTTPTATSVEVEVVENHSGHGNNDLLYVVEASENITLTNFA